MRAIIILILTTSIFFACQPESEYQKMLRTEMARGIRADSIYLGIHLGMTQKDFYDYCWNLNKQGLMQQGPSNMTVQIDVSDTLSHAANMYFYPTFVDDKIASLPITFRYEAWAPWNKELVTDSLLVDVVGALGRWYGDFTRMGDADKGYVYVRVDGNRQVKVFKQDLKNQVKAIVSDLTVDKELRDLASKGSLVTNEEQ